MGSALNQSDVERLLSQPSPHVRAIVASKLSAAMHDSDLSDHELDIAKDIIRKMAMDVELVVRQAVSKNLLHSKHLPHDVALKLARDVEAVALPILTDSEILTDEDLIELVKSSATVKQKAIASRAHVSEKLSDVIITVADEYAVATLMDNRGAEIAEQSLDKAVDRFATNELVKERMVMRESLPAAVTERLAVMVSEKLQTRLIEHHNLTPTIAMEVMQRGRESAIISMNRSASPDDIAHLVREMNHKRRLTPSIVLHGLCAGNLTFFECAVAELAGIPITNASTLIHDQGKRALESLCEKARIPSGFLPVVRIALQERQSIPLGANEDELRRYRAGVIERLLAESSNMDYTEVNFFLNLINERATYH